MLKTEIEKFNIRNFWNWYFHLTIYFEYLHLKCNIGPSFVKITNGCIVLSLVEFGSVVLDNMWKDNSYDKAKDEKKDKFQSNRLT